MTEQTLPQNSPLVIIKGGGDLASGIALRLIRCGYLPAITELEQPTAVRRGVSFAQAVYYGQISVEGVTGIRSSWSEAESIAQRGKVPVVVDAGGHWRQLLRPRALIDAVMKKCNMGTTITQAPLVLAIGPGFAAGKDVHAVVETLRGHDLGRVITKGSAADNTGIPADVGGYSRERVLRAPVGGTFRGLKRIGDMVCVGEIVAKVGNRDLVAPITGTIRGILADGVPTTAGMKVGDMDPRCRREHCFTVSDKARTVSGGILEAMLSFGVLPAQSQGN